MNAEKSNSEVDSTSQVRGPKLMNLSDQLSLLNHNFFSLGQAENNTANQSDILENSTNLNNNANQRTSIHKRIF